MISSTAVYFAVTAFTTSWVTGSTTRSRYAIPMFWNTQPALSGMMFKFTAIVEWVSCRSLEDDAASATSFWTRTSIRTTSVARDLEVEPSPTRWARHGAEFHEDASLARPHDHDGPGYKMKIARIARAAIPNKPNFGGHLPPPAGTVFPPTAAPVRGPPYTGGRSSENQDRTRTSFRGVMFQGTDAAIPETVPQRSGTSRNTFWYAFRMGHLRNGKNVHGRLQERLDRFVIGAPPAEALYEILKGLYTPEEAEIGARMPIRPTDIDGISRRTGKPAAELRGILHRMADKGLVLDFEHKGKFSYILSPTVLGFFEFAFMRARDDIPQKEIAHHMVKYAHEDPDFARAVFSGKTQFGRHPGARGPGEPGRPHADPGPREGHGARPEREVVGRLALLLPPHHGA